MPLHNEGVHVHDALTFALAPIALLVPTAIATIVPARRAWRVNPAEVMRAD
jgi:ABC-type lipoprotein release transport system permease subunit